MEKNIKKKAIIFAMSSLLAVGVAFSLSGNELEHINAAECAHNCNHYSKRGASDGNSGCKEYWVCCDCHEHWLAEPTAQTITDMGTATEVVASTDDRYIDPNCNTDWLTELGFGTVIENDDGTFTVGDFADDGKTHTSIAVPEGVSSIQVGTFKSNKITWVVIPASCIDVADGAFRTAAKTYVYFVATTTKTANQLGCAKIYQVENVGWHYVNGVPQAI